MNRFLLTLLRSRTFWRFLLVLAGACGLASVSDDINGLETLVCTILTCGD